VCVREPSDNRYRVRGVKGGEVVGTDASGWRAVPLTARAALCPSWGSSLLDHSNQATRSPPPLPPLPAARLMRHC
jgi:hypothetical protein